MKAERDFFAWLQAGAALALALVAGCSALKPFTTPAEHPTIYSLIYAPQPTKAGEARSAATPLTLIVNHPHAAAGFDSPRMMYLRRPDQLEYFAHNEWVDTPARMLAPLIVAAITEREAFRAVVQTPSPASGEIRLDTEVMRLQQEFTVSPSQVRLTLRAYLVETASRRIVAAREFEATAAAPSDDPRGGVTAAQAAVAKVLNDVAAFCAQAAPAVSPFPAVATPAATR
ncbi:MAG: hypothetical protein JWN94_1554 [Betaproteobacteria bacterium]|nr:hypothetical protein [Betaproteobacteria bacterium]